jgi:hypothetical protein
VAGVALAGAAGHAIMTNFRKRDEIGEQTGENAEQAERDETSGPGGPSSS